MSQSIDGLQLPVAWTTSEPQNPAFDISADQLNLTANRTLSVVGPTVDWKAVRHTNAADPTGAQDLATKNYVDGILGAPGHVIQDEGISLTQRINLNFTGDLVAVTDNAGNNASDVKIATGFSAKGDILSYDGTAPIPLPVGNNGEVIVADSSETSGLKWEPVSFFNKLTTKGDLLTYDTDEVRLPVGTDGQILQSDSGEATGLKWVTTSMDSLFTLGQSTDPKPGSPSLGDRWAENDTNRVYIFDGLKWVYLRTQDESENFNALQPRSSHISLFGGTFANTSASEIYLLENNDSSVGGTPLTPVNNPEFIVAEELPNRGYLVGKVESPQNWTVDTNSNIEVGDDSMCASIEFNGGVDGGTYTLFQYGANSSSAQWTIGFNIGQIGSTIVDSGGANFRQIGYSATPETTNRYFDGKWHTATMFVDRTANYFALYVDGELIASNDLGSVSLDFNSTTGLNIGARPTNSNNWIGELSNFQLYKMALGLEDYNIPALLHAGIRESARKGTGTFELVATNGSARINNNFGNNQTTDADLDYETCVINTSEGYYDLIELYAEFTNRAIAEISIDGIIYSTTDQQGALLWNISKTTNNIFLSAGSHILKIQSNGTTGAVGSNVHAYQMIELIKRDGENQGDDESSSGILFGDELQQKSNDTLGIGIQNDNIFNNETNWFNPADLNFTEGDLFIKKGLYNVTFTYTQFSTMGIIDLYFGGVKVIDGLDMNGSILRNVQVTKSVFLEGGKTPVKVEMNGSTSGQFNLAFASIRYELVTGKTNGDNVDIWYADADFQTVSGNDPELIIATSHRFNGRHQIQTTALNDEYQYSRYFSGGTYQVKLLYGDTTVGGIMDIGVGGIADNIADGLDTYAAVATINEEFFNTVVIPRGFQNVTFKAVGQNASSGGYRFRFQHLEFTKIETSLSELDNNSDPVHGALVPIAKYKGAVTVAGTEILLGGAEFSKYSKFVVELDGKANASLGLRMEVNKINSTNYYQNGWRTGATYDPITIAGNTQFTILSSTVISGSPIIQAHVELKNGIEGISRLIGTWNGSKNATGADMESGALGISTVDIAGIISQLRFFTSSSALDSNTTIDVYGVKK